MSTPTRKGLLERFASGEVVITAEGYLMELERRGYSRNGDFIPVAVVDFPDKVEDLTREFIHAGADVSSAFVYFSNKSKLVSAGKVDEFDTFNRKAHEIAKKVARETGTLFSAGLSKTAAYDPNDPSTVDLCKELFRSQMAMSAEYGVDFVHVQTLWDYGEAAIALEVSKEFNLPVIITLAPAGKDDIPKTFDGYELKNALQRLLDDGAACVGLNCSRGPLTMIPVMKHLRENVKGPLACVCNGYRTTPEVPTWYLLKHPDTGCYSFPDDMSAHYIGKSEAKWCAAQLKEIGIEFVGFCCGNSATYTRALAMTYGRTPPAARYDSLYDGGLTRGKTTFTSPRYGDEFTTYLGKTD